VTHRALGSLRSGLLKRRVRGEREVQDRVPNAVDFRSAWWAPTEEHCPWASRWSASLDLRETYASP
jgi:hypothetical protein